MSEHPYTVVVGVSATSGSPAALVWAQAQAKTNGGAVVAVRAWQTPAPQATPSGTSAGRIPVSQEVEAEQRLRLEADVAAALGPDNEVTCLLVRGGKRKALLEAAREADLLVVDAPRALSTGPAFAHRLLYGATCPIVVMPPRLSGEPPTALARAGRALGRQALRAVGTAGRPGYRPPAPPA